MADTEMSEAPVAATKAPGPLYGEIDPNSAYKKREAKILASKAATADKGSALRAAKIEAAARGEAWTPGLPASKAAEIAEARDDVAPKIQGAVYGGLPDDHPHKIRQAKILASNAPTADKEAALREARAEAAAKGETWKPDAPESKGIIAEVAPKAQGAVYGGVTEDSDYKIRQAKILASNAPAADKGDALREARAEAAAKGEAWTPNVPGTS